MLKKCSHSLEMSVWGQAEQIKVHSHLNHLFLCSDAHFELQQVFLATSRCLNMLGCWHAIG